MTMMTPITDTPPATAIRHLEAYRAERLFACRAVVGEMLAEAALALDMAAAMPSERRFGTYVQAHMRMTGAAMLLAEIDAQGEDAFRAIGTEIIHSANTADPDLVRDIAARLDAAFDIELYQIRLGNIWHRYAADVSA